MTPWRPFFLMPFTIVWCLPIHSKSILNHLKLAWCIAELFSTGVCQTCSTSGLQCTCTGGIADACTNMMGTCIIAGLSPYSTNGCGQEPVITCVDVDSFTKASSSSVPTASSKASASSTATSSKASAPSTATSSVQSNSASQELTPGTGLGQLWSVGAMVAGGLLGLR
ncbi:hypothetical protein K458DRAFT_454553 [Lentithecium fluviatile CBS 122367]|uniref:Extracellular membrane protein CFEM domain-containing protein n=1 Tax=Lentithecium fluviatile CBS 122367 TaxID=1168545 RepID=A0A6G1IWC6_9PLEO|nr:hypothetical protein K458DRAFT_454553 [Lentithecium fluviatile CBS 122367]